jgi:hypothetical protein
MVTTDRKGKPVSVFRCPSAEDTHRIDRLEPVGWVWVPLQKVIGFDGRKPWIPVSEVEAQQIALEHRLPVDQFSSTKSLTSMLDVGSGRDAVVVGTGVLGGVLLLATELTSLPPWLGVVGLGMVAVAVIIVAIDGFRAAKRLGVPWPVAVWRSVRSAFRALFEMLP